MPRSIARLAAMQLLYEQSVGGDADEDSLELVYALMDTGNAGASEKPSESDLSYIREVLSGVAENKEAIDTLIMQYSRDDWSLERVAKVDMSILRLSAYEMKYRTDVPNNVSISEAMLLANKFSEPASGRYINGVLGAIGRQMQKE